MDEAAKHNSPVFLKRNYLKCTTRWWRVFNKQLSVLNLYHSCNLWWLGHVTRTGGERLARKIHEAKKTEKG